VAAGEVEATVDAEVLQEILQRYRAIGRWEDGRRVYDLTRQLFPTVVPITATILDRARRLLDTDEGIMARDALHAAVVMAEGLASRFGGGMRKGYATTLVRPPPARLTTMAGSFSASRSNKRAGPSGVRRPASQACTNLVLTLRQCANTAWEALSFFRTFLTASASMGAGGGGRTVVRSSRFPRACSSASPTDAINSSNSFSFI